MCDVALHLGRCLELDAHSPYAAANATMYFDGFSRHHPDNRSFLGDDHLLAVNIAANVAIHLELVLGDDRDVISENGQIGADNGYTGRRIRRGFKSGRAGRGRGR